MKNIIILASVAIAISGCKQANNAVNKIINGGTAYGLQRCLEINESQIASNEATEMSCMHSIDKVMPHEHLEATARIDGTTPLELWVSVDNHSQDYILTRAIIYIKHFKDGAINRTLEETVFFGIQPKDWGGETVKFRDSNDTFNQTKFCRDESRTDCITWSIGAFGVTVP